MQVYTGGIGSYALFVMVAAFLLLHPSRVPEHEGSSRAGGHRHKLSSTQQAGLDTVASHLSTKFSFCKDMLNAS